MQLENFRLERALLEIKAKWKTNLTKVWKVETVMYVC